MLKISHLEGAICKNAPKSEDLYQNFMIHHFWDIFLLFSKANYVFPLFTSIYLPFLPLSLKNSASSDVIYMFILIRLSRVYNEDGRNYLLGPGVLTENIWFGKRRKEY
jgi:hypothetical protein